MHTWLRAGFPTILLALTFHAHAAKAPPAPHPILAGVYDCVHPHWRDTVTLEKNGSYARGNKDPGTFTFDGATLVLGWKNWSPEPLSYVQPGVFTDAKKGFTCRLRNAADPKSVIGTYDAVHRDWKDSVTLNADGTYARGNKDPGHWIFDGTTLVLFWQNWGPEPVELTAPGRFAAKDKLFTLVRRGASVEPKPVVAAPKARNVGRLISTDKETYKSGEPILVSYRGMAASPTDWTNIVTVGTATDEWGDWEYTNGEASGTRKIAKKLPPGEYEARAYFEGAVELQDRVSFTITK